MKSNLVILFVLILLVSCNPLENKLQGGWVVDQAYYNDEPVRWDLYSNGFDLKEDNTCILPPINTRLNRSLEEERGTWEAFEKDTTTYLIIETENWLFNRTFVVRNLRKTQDSVSRGNLMKMTLIVDSLKMDCTKALYE